jgi:hypothetical protein
MELFLVHCQNPAEVNVILLGRLFAPSLPKLKLASGRVPYGFPNV